MSSYLGNLLSQTTTRYNSIRRTLLSNEEDGDTEDDSHISRVLRAYYTEKGRPFPPWLPPDPNERRAVTPNPTSGYGQQMSGYLNSMTGGRGQVAALQNQNQNQTSARSSLSDLWDPPSAQPISAPAQPQSLRAGRKPVVPPTSHANTLAPPPQARPLPSQRAGSYQSVQSQHSGRSSFDPTPPGSSGGATAQDRLKARLWGGNRSGSPSNSQGPYDPPAAAGGSPYDTGGGGSSGRRYGRYG